MKKLIATVLILAVLVAAGVVFVPELAHTCGDCGKFFVGTGYKPNVVADLLKEDDHLLCKECAETSHALALLVGGNVEDYKRPLFG